MLSQILHKESPIEPSLTPKERFQFSYSTALQVLTNLPYRANRFGIRHVAREQQVEVIEIRLY